MTLPRAVLEKYLNKGDLFIETGARFGDTVIRAAEAGAGCIMSCESDRVMCAIATQHVEDVLAGSPADWDVAHEDSVHWLEKYLEPKSPAVVFLDAHTSNYSPLLRELAAIAKWAVKPRVILMDDIRHWESWGIPMAAVLHAVRAIGTYAIRREAGAVPEDILVAVRV